MADTWSDQQKQAIDTSGCNLLVSAAAGSGKTSVLAARIGRFVQEGKKLGRLLVVTFTKLAAAEMKQRIAETLRDLAAAHPENTNLRAESLKLYKANISTIDSFGIDLLRRNFHVAGISPDFSVLDENEVVIVKEGAMRSLMEEYYRTFPAGFSDYLELFGESSDSRKAEKLIQELTYYTETVPFPDRWLQRQETEFCDGDSVAKTVCALTLPYAEEYCRILEIAKTEPYEDKYIPFLLQDLDLMCSLRDLLSAGDWDGACAFVQANPLAETAKRPKGVNSAGMTLYSEYHGAYKEFWNNELFALTAADLKQDLAKMREGLRFLYRAVADFRKGVRKEMARRNGYSFAVISEMALELVVSDYDYDTKSFTPSPAALRERARYDEVLIDEYQDVNDMQDLFFRAITENNCFAVGDVKQSIYGFRGSNPDNFLRKKETCKTIPMNWNFRSRAGILDYVNFLFRGLFSVEVGGMEYDQDEAFVPKRNPDGSNPYPQNYAETLPPSRVEDTSAQKKDPEPHTELLLIPQPSSKSRNEDDLDDAEGEARLCVKLICDAINDAQAKVYDKRRKEARKLKYSDIYILMRTSKAVPTFEKVFREANIPLLSVDGGTFLETPEVGGILAFLQTVNDPWDDLSLFVTLTGSVFAFTSEEVSLLKDPKTRRPLWDGVLVAAETDPRWQAVVDTVEKYRILSENVSVARLVWTVYTATDFLALESAADPNARRNLMKFYSFARSYTRADGLFGFLEHAERARASEKVKQNDAASEGEFVRIMTIHKSKGLEAPWCIIPELGSGFKNDTNPVSFDSEFGVAMKVRNDEGTASYNTLLLEAVKMRKKRKEVAERLRVLYVALTRARDRLTMIGCCSMDTKSLGNHAVHAEKGKVRLSTLLKNNNYRSTLLDRTVLHPQATAIHSAFVAPEVCKTEDLRVAFVGIPESVGGGVSGGNNAVSCGLSQAELQQRFSFRYDGHLSTVPAKVSVTEIAKDPPPPDAAILLREPSLSKPQFLNEKALSGAELGTALHTYCQFADFDRPVEEEQQRLVREGHLTPEAVEAMDGEQLFAFLESPLMDCLRNSKGYRREVRFVCRIPVSYYSGNPGDEGEMLMQGAMDLLYETEDGYVIVDFKSDRTTEEELLNRYSRQLNLYAAAVRRLYDKPVLGCKIWSFYLKKEIPVKEEML